MRPEEDDSEKCHGRGHELVYIGGQLTPMAAVVGATAGLYLIHLLPGGYALNATGLRLNHLRDYRDYYLTHSRYPGLPNERWSTPEPSGVELPAFPTVLNTPPQSRVGSLKTPMNQIFMWEKRVSTFTVR